MMTDIKRRIVIAVFVVGACDGIVAAGPLSQNSETTVAPVSRWVRIDRTPVLAVYLDSFRIEKLPGAQLAIWTRWDFSAPQRLVDKEFDRIISKYTIDCAGVRSMQIESTFYQSDKLVFHLSVPDSERKWTSALPESANETLIVRSCLIGAGQPVAEVP